MANAGGPRLFQVPRVSTPLSSPPPPPLPVSLLPQPSVHLQEAGVSVPPPPLHNRAYRQEALVCEEESGRPWLTRSPLLQLQDVALD